MLTTALPLHTDDGAVHKYNGAVHEYNGAVHKYNGVVHEYNGAVHEYDGANNIICSYFCSQQNLEKKPTLEEEKNSKTNIYSKYAKKKYTFSCPKINF